MPNLQTLLEQSAARHTHLCPRQVLGVRMGLLAGQWLGLELPQRNKRLFTFAESDGCGTGGISVATGCWVDRRTLCVMDFGKLAATFVDTQTERAVRIHPHPDCRTATQSYAPDAPDRWHQQLAAYQIMPDSCLLVAQEVRLTIDLARIISQPGLRVLCERCGEEVSNEREVIQHGETLCRACAGESYYTIPQSERKCYAYSRDHGHRQIRVG